MAKKSAAARKPAKKRASKKRAAKRPAAKTRVVKTRRTTTATPRHLPITALMVGGKAFKAGRGHYFAVTPTGVALMRGNRAQANFTCECSNAGGCRVEIDGQTATCLENGCSGSCGWVVNIPGLAGFPNLAVLRG